MTGIALAALTVLPALTAGCAEEPATEAVAPPPLMIELAAPPAGPDDVVVARVAGRPVWGSCVAAQARGRKLDARAALADCVDLELAAQEAERRGLDRDPDVHERTQQALVARMIDRGFSARYQSAADLPASFVQPIFERNAWRLERAEYRGSFYARVDAPEERVPRGSAADAAAAEVARAAYASLAGRKDLFPADVERALRAAAGPIHRVDASPFKPTTGDNVLPYYRDALFARSAIGEVSPPVRGPFGWDLVLWTSVLPAQTWTRDEVLAQLFTPMRQRFFLDWAAQAGRGHQVELVADRATTERLLGGAPSGIARPAPAGPPGTPP